MPRMNLSDEEKALIEDHRQRNAVRDATAKVLDWCYAYIVENLKDDSVPADFASDVVRVGRALFLVEAKRKR